MQDDDGYVDFAQQVIMAAPEHKRPGPGVVCAQRCPKATWILEEGTEGQEDELRCFCNAMDGLIFPKRKAKACQARLEAIAGLR